MYFRWMIVVLIAILQNGIQLLSKKVTELKYININIDYKNYFKYTFIVLIYRIVMKKATQVITR